MAREINRQEAEEVKQEIHELVNSYDQIYMPRKNSCGVLQSSEADEDDDESPRATVIKYPNVHTGAEQPKRSPKSSKKKKKNLKVKEIKKEQNREEDQDDPNP